MTLHFLHVGKTGGTAIKGVLRHQLGVPDTPFGPLNLPSADNLPLRKVPPEDYVLFCVRDPIARFASAFYSRLHQGQPRYWFPWNDWERDVFTRWPTPQALADALASPDPEERAAAEFAMNHVRHVHRMSDRLGSRSLLEERADRIVYVGRQETLAADWQHLREILDLPRDSQLPNDPVQAHRGDPKDNRDFSPKQRATLEEWYAEDYAIVEFAERLRGEHGWGVPIPDAVPGLAPPGERPSVLAPGPLSREKVSVFLDHKLPSMSVWTELIDDRAAATVAEIGVHNGELAQRVLNGARTVQTYYLLGPATGPGAGEVDDETAGNFASAVERTEYFASRRVVLEGPIDKGLEQVPDGSVDVFLLGAGYDSTLRGLVLALHRIWPKLRPGGWIGGGEFNAQLFQQGLSVEPALAFPYAVHFAELKGCPIFALTRRQFLIENDPAKGFEFVDITGRYRLLDLAHQLPQAVQRAERDAAEAEAAQRQRQRQRQRQAAAQAGTRTRGRRSARRVVGAAARRLRSRS